MTSATTQRDGPNSDQRSDLSDEHKDPIFVNNGQEGEFYGYTEMFHINRFKAGIENATSVVWLIQHGYNPFLTYHEYDGHNELEKNGIGSLPESYDILLNKST